MTSEQRRSREPPVECKKLSYTTNSFDHLQKWIEPLRKDAQTLIDYRTSFSTNAVNFIYDNNPPPIGKDKKPDMTSPNNFGNVSLEFQIEEGSVAKKRNILSLVAKKFIEKKQIFVEIECLEYGVNSKIAEDRVNLIHQLLRDISSFHNETQKLTIKRHRNIYERIPSFHELFWLVAVSILEDGPSFREIRVDKPVLLFSFLLAEVLNECNIPAKTTVCYTLFAVIWEEDYTVNRVPMIIFSNADIDSALDACVNAAWFTEGLVPWATTSILIQESIYTKFVSSLKSRLQKSVENISLLLTNLNVEDHTEENVKIIISAAKEHHLEVFQVLPFKKNCVPVTLVIGDVVPCHVSYNDRATNKTLPILFVVPFRTVHEAVSMANSSSNRVAASVWSESYSTCSPVVSQLSFGTIWVNSYGIFDSRVPFFSQSSGCQPVRPVSIDYFHWSKSLEWKSFIGNHDYSEDEKQLPETEWRKLLTAANVAHLSWMQKDMHDRMKILDDVWKHISGPNSSLSPAVKKQLVDVVCGKVPSGSSFQTENCLVSSSIEPIGIVIFIIGTSYLKVDGQPIKVKRHHLLKHLLSAVFSKNAVIVSGDTHDLSALKKNLPENVLSVTGRISVGELCDVVPKQLQGSISVWELDDSRAKHYTLNRGRSQRNYVFDMDLDIRPHMVRRKVVWMPLI